MSTLRYSRSSLAAALRSGGIGSGDTVLVHLDLAALGDAEGAPTPESRNALVRDALFDAAGPEGTILVPTYSFSFCRREDFDPETTPAVPGAWNPAVDFSEEFRKLPGAVRSRDPIHSVAGVGPRAQELLENVPGTCFGAGSVFHRLLLAGAKICTIGLGLDEATSRHHVEERVGVPYRFKKLFTGKVKENGTFRKMGWVYYVRILADNAFPDGSRLASLAEEEGICRPVPVGAGRVRVVSCRAFDDLTERALRRDPWFTARGPAGDPIELEKARVGASAARGAPALPGRDGEGHRRRPLAPAAEHRVGRLRHRAVGARRHGPDDGSRVSERSRGGNVDRAREVDVPRGVPRDARRPAALFHGGPRAPRRVVLPSVRGRRLARGAPPPPARPPEPPGCGSLRLQVLRARLGALLRAADCGTRSPTRSTGSSSGRISATGR